MIFSPFPQTESLFRRKVKRGDSSEWPHNQIYFRLSARWVYVGVGGGGGGGGGGGVSVYCIHITQLCK